MNKLFTKIAALSVGLAMAIGVGVALKGNETRGARATETVYKLARFGNGYNDGNSSYTDSFDATNGTFVVTATNFNNNNNGWTNGDGYGQIKCGRKNNTSTASIATKAAIDDAITNVSISIDAITASKINSIKLFTSSNNSTWNEKGSYTKSTGLQSVELNNPTANLYYKIVFDCASGSSNGLVTISKVEYYHNEAPTPSVSLDEITNASATVTAIAGDDDWTITNASATGIISGEEDQDVTEYVDFSINEGVPETSGTPEVTLKVSPKVGVEGDAVDYTTTVTATVNDNPISTFKLIKDASISTSSIYLLGNDGETFATGSVTSSKLGLATEYSKLGFFKFIETETDNEYYIQFVTYNGSEWIGGKYLGYNSGTDLKLEDDPSTYWESFNWVDETDESIIYGVVLSPNGLSRTLAFNSSTVSGSTGIKAYNDSNLPNTNLPAYLYLYPQDKITNLAVNNPKNEFVAGNPFTYIKDGTTSVIPTYDKAGVQPAVSSGLTYTLGNEPIEIGDILTHDDDGKTVVITYTDDDGLSKAAVGYTISVAYAPLDDDELVISETSLSVPLSAGSYQLSASITNQYADPTLTWSSGSPSVATVDNTGLVTFVSGGDVVITVTGANGIYKNCSITITTAPELTLNITSISDKWTGDSDVTITPTYANIPDGAVFTWTSTNTEVATVTKGEGNVGVVHFEGTSSKEESITLTITKDDETVISASCTLSNIKKSQVLNFQLNTDVATIYDGDFNNTVQLIAQNYTLEGNATEGVTWSTSNPEVATVDGGLVTAVSAGSVTITATSIYTSTVQKTCSITVLQDEVTKIEWDGKNTPSSFFTGDILGEKTNWTFDITWSSGKKENGKNWGTGENDVHLGIYPNSPAPAPTEETADPISQNYELKISDHNKRLTPFYKGGTTSAKILSVVQSAVTDIAITCGERIVDNCLTMYDTETLTLDYAVSGVGNYTEKINWSTSDETILLFEEKAGNKIDICGSPCDSVTLTATSDFTGTVSTTITITILEDSVQSLTWTGAQDCTIYEDSESMIGEFIDSSSWSFSASWNAKEESNLTVGDNDDQVHIGVFDTDSPSAYTIADKYDEYDIASIENFDGKYLVAFYRNVPSSEAIKIQIVQRLNTVYKSSSAEEEFSWAQTNSSTPDFTNTSTSITIGGVEWSKNTQSQTYVIGGSGSRRYLQIGRSATANTLTLSTSNIEGKITKISVDCGRGSAKSTISATVNNVNYIDNQEIPLFESNVGGVVSGTGSSSGEIVITIAGLSSASSGKQVYIHSIEIEYEQSSKTPINDDTDHIIAQDAVVEFAQYMNTRMNMQNVCSGTGEMLLTEWSNVASKYNELFGTGEHALTGTQLQWAQDLLANADSNWSELHDSDEKYCLERAMKTYDWCVKKRGCTAFMEGVRTPKLTSYNPLLIINAKVTNTSIIVVISSIVAIASVAGYFYFRKRKEQD